MLNKSGKLIWLTIGMFAVLIVSCAAPPSTTAPPLIPAGSEDMIEPGDMIGEMVVRTAKDESETEPAIWDYCDTLLAELSEAKKVECVIPFQPHYFLPGGVVESDQEQLNSLWESLTFKISINGQPIDLDSFGTIDALGGRNWNVVLENPTHGPHRIETIVSDNEDPSDRYGMTLDLMVAEPTPSSSTTAPPLTPAGSEDMIEPGDMIGKMVISAVEFFQGDNHLGLYCLQDDFDQVDPETREYACEAYPGNLVQLDCLGWIADSTEELEELWPTSTWLMTIDGEIIDLPAFGTIDNIRDDQKLVRFWNVLIEGIAPGTHTVDCDEVVEGEGRSVSRWIFNVPDQVKTYSPLPEEGVAGQHPYTSEKAQLNLLLYFPDEYGQDPQKKWPLILYLHGSLERGSDLDRLRKGSLPGILEGREDFPFIVASPQLSGRSGEEFWRLEDPTNAVLVLLDEIQSDYAVDTKRVSFSGVSNGGGGVWEIGLAHPERFAALVPVMGYYGWPYKVPDNICDLKDTPIWAFHGEKDEILPLDVEQGLVDALEACDGDVRFTVYPNRGHDIENLPYSDLELIDWLLSQEME